MSAPNKRNNIPEDRYYFSSRLPFDQEAFNLTPSQAATSEYGGTMGDNQTESRTRLTSYTYESENAEKFLKKVDNRAFNALSETYFLPTDEEEWTRLDKQHVALVIGLGGLYPASDIVRAVLAPQDGEQKRILDLGCGTAVWTNEMAREFAHAAVIGVDLAPTPVDVQSVPSNCRFEIDVEFSSVSITPETDGLQDINLGLQHFANKMDLVHARLISSGLQDFRRSMEEAQSCLKPGGLLIAIDTDYDLYTHRSGRFEYLPFASDNNPSGSWFQRFSYEVRRAGARTGKSDMDGASQVLDEGFWDHPLMDPETCRTASLYLPLGPWPVSKDVNQAQQMRYVGALMRQDVMNLHRATHSVLKNLGWPREMLDEWSEQADEELMKNKHSLWWRVRIAWGRRRAGPGQPAPPLPEISSSGGQKEEDYQPLVWPHLYVHETKEKAIQEMALRNRGKDISPPPSPPIPC